MDRDGAFFVLGAASALCDRLKLIWADMGYRGARLKTWIEQECGWQVEIVQRPRKWGWYPSLTVCLTQGFTSDFLPDD